MHTGRILHHTSLTVIYVPFLYQWTPLHIAAREGHDDTVKFLVENKADVNNISVDGVSVTILLIVD